jgi:hypothetical protein
LLKRAPVSATNVKTTHRQNDTVLDIGGALPSSP